MPVCPLLKAIPITNPDFVTSPLVSGLLSKTEAFDKGSQCHSSFYRLLLHFPDTPQSFPTNECYKGSAVCQLLLLVYFCVILF